MKKFIPIFLIGILAMCIVLPVKAETPNVVATFAQTMTLASTEYKIILGNGVKSFSVQCRGDYDLRIAWVAGGTTLNYRTIKYLTTPVYYSPSVLWNGVFYLRCEQAGQIAEIEYWK